MGKSVMCSCEESIALRAEVAGLEKVNAELRAKVRALGEPVEDSP